LFLAAYGPFIHLTQALHRQQMGFHMYLPTTNMIQAQPQARGHSIYGS
jgi:hypothetical protein